MQMWACFDLHYFFLSYLIVYGIILPEAFWHVYRYMECKPSSCFDRFFSYL